MSKDIVQLSVRKLLNGKVDYIIPMYQRNYAWEEGEITQLIQDVIDYMPEGRNYYIGTLVVFMDSERTVYETIDGQQRLTTLSLLVSYLKNNNLGDFDWYDELKIHFESREHSSKTFSAIFEGRFSDDPAEVLQPQEMNTAIINGYLLIQKLLLRKLEENKVDRQSFIDFLLNKVQIMRVKVPHDTDLNHYFEIMNNRGEQLEKHEVLKSKMLEVLNGIEDESEREASRNCLHRVWEACANMEKYVQMGFTPAQRNALFGDKDWGSFETRDFDDLQEKLWTFETGESDQNTSRSLNELIAGVNLGTGEKAVADEGFERFNSVINFPNFLLHVLRVLSKKDIPLDDKRLVSTFESKILKSKHAIRRVKKFTYALLKCKYLLDQYVIKREFIKGTDGWSLKRLKWNDGGDRNRSGRASYVNAFGEDELEGGINRRLLMLLSAFHVSTPTMVYKHWLNAALYHLFYAEEIKAEAYLGYLESVAKAFVYDRFLAANEGAEYFDIIYTQEGQCRTVRQDISESTLKSRLTFGNIENNLIFNFLDYLLWLEHKENSGIVRGYEFTFRSSVEHYYPQNPQQGFDHLVDDVLNSFGNLCLISHSKNSRLSNFMPEAKKEYYKNNTIDSIKQYLMMGKANWNEEAIGEHYNEMTGVLLECLNENIQGMEERDG